VLVTQHGLFVAPDNGVLSHIRSREQASQAYLLDKPQYWRTSPSNTFHGRDIFSPVAAHLANGTHVGGMGSPLDQITMLNLVAPSIGSSSIRGEVIRVDHFGNALTNIAGFTWINSDKLEFIAPNHAYGETHPPVSIDPHKARINCGWHTLSSIYETYSQVPIGQPLALIGSSGELELAINQGSAADVLAIRVGTAVTLHFN
jgi:S-adenosylmethionine hydrolase